MPTPIKSIVKQVRECCLCSIHLPMAPRPIIQIHQQARILIAGQAPGKKVHKTGIPFDDSSGQRLREWMGIDAELFYDPEKIAILPMGFCYPGSGKSGDLPPRPECAQQWRNLLLSQLQDLRLTLVIGQYAQQWHLGKNKKSSLTETVSAWQYFWPTILPLPHPSPRNNRWFKNNPWFEKEVVPALQLRVKDIIRS
jgi:uracil-DNA glycosylase